ncbi:MAG: superinfection exclusion B family protein [Opitutales bacterium]
MDPLKSILEFLKLTPRYLMAVSIFCAVLLFSPKEFLDQIGAFEFTENYRSWIGLAFLGSLCISIVGIGSGILGWIKSFRYRRKVKKRIVEKLHRLTENEKQILRYYIAKQTKSNMLRTENGVVKGLEASHIIYRAATLGNVLEGFAHNISEVAWDYLNENQALLLGDTDFYYSDSREERYL